MMVERRVTFDVAVEVQEGEAGENIARAALIRMARSLIEADEDIEAAAEANGWKFFVEAPTVGSSGLPFPEDPSRCPYPGYPMVVIEPGGGWPHWPPVGTVVWARVGNSERGELFAYDGEGWRGMTVAQYAEQQALLDSQVQISRASLRQGNHRAAERSKSTVYSALDGWARRLGKDPDEWTVTPPTT